MNPGLSDSGTRLITGAPLPSHMRPHARALPVMGSGVQTWGSEVSQFYSKSFPRVLLSPFTEVCFPYLKDT